MSGIVTGWALGIPVLRRSFNTPKCCRHRGICGCARLTEAAARVTVGSAPRAGEWLMKTPNQANPTAPRPAGRSGAGTRRGSLHSFLFHWCKRLSPLETSKRDGRAGASHPGAGTQRCGRASCPRPALGVGVPPRPLSCRRDPGGCLCSAVRAAPRSGAPRLTGRAPRPPPFPRVRSQSPRRPDPPRLTALGPRAALTGAGAASAMVLRCPAPPESPPPPPRCPTQAGPRPLRRRRPPGPAFPTPLSHCRRARLLGARGRGRGAGRPAGGARVAGRLSRAQPATAPQLALCGHRAHPRDRSGLDAPPARRGSAPPAGPGGHLRPTGWLGFARLRSRMVCSREVSGS